MKLNLGHILPIVALSLSVACGNNANESLLLSSSDACISSSQPLSKVTLNQSFTTSPTNLPEHFYLAVHPDAFDENWLMTVSVNQLNIDGLVSPPQTLATEVVRFQVQNEQLYIINASNSDEDSLFEPENIIDVYPIETRGEQAGCENRRSIIFDPSRGQNRLSVVGNSVGVPLVVDLSYLQNLKVSEQGIYFEQTLSATSPTGNETNNDGQSIRNVSSTLGISFERYTEEIESFPISRLAEFPRTYYFSQNDIYGFRRHRNAVAKWDIRPGMEPIVWTVAQDLTQELERVDGDLLNPFEAIKQGIEAWNDVFGYEVFRVEPADENTVYGNHHQNFILSEDNSASDLPFAYADMRMDPITGQIRGANVFLGLGIMGFSPSEPETSAPSQTANQRLSWNGHEASRICSLGPKPQASTSVRSLTDTEAAITNLVLHEVGHTLGLRHNFRGSLASTEETPPTSVMDYLTVSDEIRLTEPGIFDRYAIDLLYPTTRDDPESWCEDTDVNVCLDFCPDELLGGDCNRFDSGPEPLNSTAIPRWDALALAFEDLDGPRPPEAVQRLVQFAGNDLIRYILTGNEEQVRQGYEALTRSPTVTLSEELDTTILYFRDSALIYSIAAILGFENFDWDQETSTELSILVLDFLRDEIADDLVVIAQETNGLRSIDTRQLAIRMLFTIERVASRGLLTELILALEANLAQQEPGSRDYADTESLIRTCLRAIDELNQG